MVLYMIIYVGMIPAMFTPLDWKDVSPVENKWTPDGFGTPFGGFPKSCGYPQIIQVIIPHYPMTEYWKYSVNTCWLGSPSS